MSAPYPQRKTKYVPHLRPNRTREGQRAKQFRAELVAHLGGNPSVPQMAIIEQAAQIKFRLLVMDSRFLQTGEVPKDYVTWNGGLARLLRQLGMKPPKPQQQRTPTLVEYFTAKAVSEALEPPGAPPHHSTTSEAEPVLEAAKDRDEAGEA